MALYRFREIPDKILFQFANKIYPDYLHRHEDEQHINQNKFKMNRAKKPTFFIRTTPVQGYAGNNRPLF